jgi:MFS family permease
LTLLILANQPGASMPLPFGDSTVTLALSPHATLTVVYVLAFGMGLAQAFGIPSGTSILPRALAPEFLQAANGMLMGLRQLTMLAGPLLAAALLYFGSDAHGLAFAFGFDCVSFLVSAWTLSHVRMRAAPPRPPENQSVLGSIGAGLKMVWDDVPLRLCFFYWGLVTLLIGGSMQVALPLLASERLHGAAALGLLMGAHGAGTLIGMAGAAKGGALLGKNKISFGSMILLVDVIAGLLVAPLGMAQTTWQAMALLATLGLLTGFVQIAVFTWLQRRVPAHMMGRAMSIFMFIFVGLAPLSAAGAGWLLTLLTLQQMFAGGGLILVSLASAAYLFTPMRGITSAK